MPPFRYNCKEKSCGGPYTSGQIHTAQLKPLKPKTEYFYKIGNNGPVTSFNMPPTAETISGDFSFGLIGVFVMRL